MAKKAKEQKMELAAQLRDITGRRVKHLRAEGNMPAVLYGRGQEAKNIQVPTKAFEQAYKTAGESTLVYLGIGKDSYPTIIKDVARDAVTGKFLHADFYKVSLTEKIKAMVPVVFTGESPAVRDLKAIFVRNVNELEVEALPQDLPHEIDVDVSGLKAFGDQVTLGDIKGHGWVLTGEAGEIVATVQEPKSEEELAAELAAPTTDVSAVEELKKEKPVEEGAEEGEAAPVAAPAPEAKKE